MALERLIEDGYRSVSPEDEKGGPNPDKVVGSGARTPPPSSGCTASTRRCFACKLQFHQVLGQDQLLLAINVAHLSELIAESLGQSPKVARRAGLLSLVGRAVDHFEGSVAKDADRAAKHGARMLVVAALQDLASDDPATVAGMIVSSALKLAENRPGARQSSWAGRRAPDAFENPAASEEGAQRGRLSGLARSACSSIQNASPRGACWRWRSAWRDGSRTTGHDGRGACTPCERRGISETAM